MARTRTVVRPLCAGEEAMQGRESMQETKDCIVRAITNAACGEYTYEEVHAVCRQHGRVNNQGMTADMYFPLLVKLGFELKFVSGTTNAAMFADRVAKELQLQYRRVKGITLERARCGLGKGSFFVAIIGHATCIVNGNIYDKGAMKGGCSVTHVWKFKGKPQS
jgi:hypothetical protein